jgi:hypothetical protein
MHSACIMGIDGRVNAPSLLCTLTTGEAAGGHNQEINFNLPTLLRIQPQSLRSGVMTECDTPSTSVVRRGKPFTVTGRDTNEIWRSSTLRLPVRRIMNMEPYFMLRNSKRIIIHTSYFNTTRVGTLIVATIYLQLI